MKVLKRWNSSIAGTGAQNHEEGYAMGAKLSGSLQDNRRLTIRGASDLQL